MFSKTVPLATLAGLLLTVAGYAADGSLQRKSPTCPVTDLPRWQCCPTKASPMPPCCQKGCDTPTRVIG